MKKSKSRRQKAAAAAVTTAAPAAAREARAGTPEKRVGRPDTLARTPGVPTGSMDMASARPVPRVGLDLIVREVLEVGAAKAKALLCLYLHARKVRAAARELADALAESRDVWNWPGDRLPVGDEMSQHVEKLTHRLKIETDAHHRLESLSRTVGWGRSVQTV